MRNIYSLLNAALFIYAVLYSSVSLADPVDREEAFSKVKDLIRTGDVYMGLEYIQNQAEPEDVCATFINISDDFYLKDKSLIWMTHFSKFGVHYCIIKSEEFKNNDPQRSIKLQLMARQLAYNLSYYSWIGQADEKVFFNPMQLEIGRDSARLFLRLSEQMGLDGEELVKAHWLLGVQFLSKGWYERASKELEAACKIARKSDLEIWRYRLQAYSGMALAFNDLKTDDDFNKMYNAVKKLEAMKPPEAKEAVEEIRKAYRAITRDRLGIRFIPPPEPFMDGPQEK